MAMGGSWHLALPCRGVTPCREVTLCPGLCRFQLGCKRRSLWGMGSLTHELGSANPWSCTATQASARVPTPLQQPSS